ncbi:MAG: peptidoglycan-associated lipoprotein [Desulfuromonas sp.]|jgi:peptidoglycan-associated lipoprotein|nr:MAG: peptidoglycan-associated lipoprotein [Desulfuromonas sp.]
MKIFKLLCLFALTLILAAGCAKPASNDIPPDEACEVTDVAPTTETVPSYTDTAVTEPVVEAAPVIAAVLSPVYFEFDQYTLSDAAREALAENMRYLQTNPGTSLVIEGHCDERGSDEYNLALGERRAVAAQQYLVSMGVDPQRLSTISYGEEKPVDLANTEEAWAKNRRAEFVPKP